ncbi:ATP-grasp domain-containing protein [Neobacillus terrae]|uniref:ATP-grasp domain-containing protein n=1 Tax=Neobacillus terrae TaxID=3034837 RepID=UPI00140DFE71|nr:ATP-grasp domain-containing protein [Neobacillus terrae]NHM32652.1 ATP-grasp domain-containing protein [Neobacillus terrae]
MNIWFNRWFTTAAHFIELIRNNPESRKFTIYGTHSNLDALYLQVCDFAYSEPDVEGEEYIDFCLDFCQNHQIDIFIPRTENVLISKRLEKFHSIGVKVLVCPDYELMKVLDNKVKAYQVVGEKTSIRIPEYFVVNNAEEFKDAYQTLRERGRTVCMKPAVGEGACGFRVIKENIDTVEQLIGGGNGYRIPYPYAFEILSQKEHFSDLIVMEFLEGTEYSIDCLASTKKLFTAVPRMKGDGRVRELIENHELIQLAHEFYKEFRLPYVFNIQFKYSMGIPKLLEINPRMSGGLHISCLSGVNYPYLALKLLLGEEIKNLSPQFGIRASHLEKEMILDSKII